MSMTGTRLAAIIRSAAKTIDPNLTKIRVSLRACRSGVGNTFNARDWADDVDLFDNVDLRDAAPQLVRLLRAVRTTDPSSAVLDLWIYEGRGDTLDLQNHQTLVISPFGDMVRVTHSHYRKVCR